jgi:hypothetical protein
MAQHYPHDTVAPYRWGQDECTFVTGIGAVTLESSGFGSCVGLVLHCPATGAGAVAHFAGSLGNTKSYADKAEGDTAEILAHCPIGADWNVWIFGGESLTNSGFADSSAVKQTKGLIDRVRAALAAAMGHNFVHQTTGYPGYRAVKLDCTTGEVTFTTATTTGAEVSTTRKQRSGSLG